MKHRRPAVLSKWPLFLALTLVALGQAASYVHQVTVHHGVCAEHGEPVDSERAVPAGDSGVLDALAKAAYPAAEAPTLATLADGHSEDDHCLIATARREWLKNSPRATCSCQTTPTPPAQVLEDARFAALSIVLYAPKHSPPAA